MDKQNYHNKKRNIYSLGYLFFNIAENIFVVLQPLILKKIFDNISQLDRIVYYLIIYGISIILIILFEFFQKRSHIQLSLTFKEDLNNQLLCYLDALSIEKTSNIDKSDLNVDINTNIDELIQSYYINNLNIIYYVISLMIYLITIFSIDLHMAIVTILFNVICLILPLFFRNIIKNRKQEVIQSNSDYNNSFFDLFDGLATLKQYGSFQKWRKKTNWFLSNFIKHDRKYFHINVASDILIGFASYLGSFILILIGAIKIFLNKLSVGGFIAAFQYSELIVTPIMNLGTSFNIRSTGLALRDDFHQKYNIDPDPTLEGEMINTSDIDEIDCILFRDFEFGYAPDEILITIDDLRINVGDKILLIGKNGSGKSTFLKIIAKQISGYRGDIFLNSIDLKKISYSNLYKLISYIPQEDHIFQANINENITMNQNVNIEDDKMAQLININILPDSILKQELLSGGEKQKIGFLRAYITQRRLLLIDEGLNKVESNIRNSIISELCKNKDITLVYITHDYKEILSYFDYKLICHEKKIIKEKI